MQKFISCPGFPILRICYNSSIFHLTFPARWPIYITMLTMTITNTLASPFREEFRLGQDAHAIVPYSRAISKLRRPVVVSNFVGRQGGGTASVRPLPCESIGPIGPFQTISSRYCSSEGRPSSPPDRLIRPAFLCSQAEFSPWRPAGFLSRYSYSPLFSHGPAGPFAIDDDAEQATRRLTTGAKDGPGRGRR